MHQSRAELVMVLSLGPIPTLCHPRRPERAVKVRVERVVLARNAIVPLLGIGDDTPAISSTLSLAHSHPRPRPWRYNPASTLARL